ncbi:MAG: hypothetical protein GY715_18205 [Planctomycetes bacterium]|nr:hypothetical protein [Planctomycetota bacterium]
MSGTPPPKRRRRRWLRNTLLVLIVIVIFAGAWAWRRAGAPPEWYAPPDPADAQVAQLAERVEYGMVQEFHRIRPRDESWRMRVDEDEVNAWFAARLPEWIAHHEEVQWPETLGAPQVRVAENGMEIALQVEGDHVLVTRVVPEITDGGMRLVLDRVGVGWLTMPGAPASRMLEILEDALPEGTVGEDLAPRLIGLLTGSDLVDARIELSDGRSVELMDMLLSDGAIEFTSRTHPPAGP